MRKFLLLTYNMLIIITLSSQENSLNAVENIVSDRLEMLSVNSESEDIDYTNLTENLTYFFNHPIVLDEKCENSLRELQLLTNIQINDMVNHIQKYGSIRNISELQQIESLSLDDILTISPFIRSNNTSSGSLNTIDKSTNHHFRLRYKEVLQSSRGYNELKYKGPKYALYSRYNVKYKNLLIAGLTLEKDAGEVLFQKNQLSDFQSAFLQYQPSGRIKKVILGDFKAVFGQGLTFSNAGGVSKSSEVLLINRSFDEISPYRSVNESGYLRGLAAEFSIRRFTTRSFISSTRQDATTVSTSSGTSFSSISTSGLHRTENEQSKFKSLTNSIAGLSSIYKLRHGEIGILGVHQQFSLPGEQLTELYNKQVSKEKNRSVYGLHFRYTKNNFSAFSEISKSLNKGKAGVIGMLFMPDKHVGISILARKFDHNYATISSAGFGEKSQTQNEEGIYSGLRIDLPKRMRLSAFADIFSFNHPSFQSNFGGQGVDYFLELKRKSRKDREWLVQLKWSEKPQDVSLTDLAIKNPSIEINKRLRIQYQCLLLESLRLRSRVEFSEYLFNEVREQGLLMFQELKYAEIGVNWSVLCRYTLFDTEGYNSRIYTYEQNVQGAYSIPSFSGKGSKIMCLINYKVKKGIKLSLKFNHLIYPDRAVVGSSLDEINGQEKTEITTQIDITF